MGRYVENLKKRFRKLEHSSPQCTYFTLALRFFLTTWGSIFVYWIC
jgi:hypothetical protein